MRYIHLISACVIVFASVIIPVVPSVGSSLEAYGVESISSVTVATIAVANLTGLPMDDSGMGEAAEYSVKIVPTVESQVAFVAGEINNQRAWLIELELPDIGPLIRTEEQQALADGNYVFPKRFEVFIDSVSGRFLEARTVYDGEHELLFREPTEHEAFEQLTKNEERYHGLPDSAPEVTMIDAMKVCHGWPIVALEMRISYVLHSYKGSEPIPCWVILARGLQSVVAGGNFQKTTPAHHTMRHVVDAMTGERIISINMPHCLTDENGISYFPTIDSLQTDKK